MEEPEIFELLAPVAAAQGVELVEVSVAGGRNRAIVRLIVHAEDGVTHSVCARVTRAASPALDAAGAFPGAYVLEVWSPGTDRVLKSPREFDLFRGQLVQVTLVNEAEAVTGRAAGTRAPESVVLTRGDGSEEILPWSRIAKARLRPEPSPRGTGRG